MARIAALRPESLRSLFAARCDDLTPLRSVAADELFFGSEVNHTSECSTFLVYSNFMVCIHLLASSAYDLKVGEVPRHHLISDRESIMYVCTCNGL